MLVKWSATIKHRQVYNEIISHLDWMPTLLAATGDADIKAKLKAGMQVGSSRVQPHPGGYNLLPHFTDINKAGPRREFIYSSDNGDIISIRDGDYKMVFKEQRVLGFSVWQDPWLPLRIPKIFNFKVNPLERMGRKSAGYRQWLLEHAFLVLPSIVRVGRFNALFKGFPQRQKSASFVRPHCMLRTARVQALKSGD